MSNALISPDSVRRLTKVSPSANLWWLLLDHLLVLAVSGVAVGVVFALKKFGFHWGWQIPVWGAAMIVNGCLAHRIALMGHEASHHLLLPDRKWNDVLAQLFCFFPVFGTIDQYRWKHRSHHHHPNDPERDPNLGGGKARAHYDRFPMPRGSFFLRYYLMFFWPPFVVANLIDLLAVVIRNQRDPDNSGGKTNMRPALATLLGIAYFVLLLVGHRVCLAHSWNPLYLYGGLYAGAFGVWWMLPVHSFRGKTRVAVPVKLSAWMRFTFYTVLYLAFSLITETTGFNAMRAYLLLWVVPLVYVFPYLMLLREVYQHANAGTGRLDNSRVIHAGPFTRWAVLGYGNAFHLIHHIYPNIPHYRLREAHERLLAESGEYRSAVRETFGLRSSDKPGEKSLFDDLEAPSKVVPKSRKTGRGKRDFVSPASR